MGFVFFLSYLVIWFLFPAELFPELIPYRIPFWLGVLGLVISVLTIAPTGKFILRAWPITLIAGLIISMMLSVIWVDRWLGAPVHVLQAFGPVLTLYLLVIWNITSLRRLRITGAVLVMLAIVMVGQCVAAYHFGYMQDKFLLRGTGEPRVEDQPPSETDDPVRVRALGLMNDPNDLALFLLAALPFTGLAWKPGRTSRNLAALGIPAAFLIYGIYLTRSRGGLLGILAVVFVALIGRISRTKALVATLVLASMFLGANFTGGREVSTSEESAARRLDAWSEGLAMFRSSPVLGVGYLNFTEHNDLTAHNSFVLCFAELGLLGYFFWMALLVVAIQQIRQVRHNASDGSDGQPLHQYATVLLSCFAGVLVAAFFLSRSYNPVLYLLVGLSFASTVVARNGGQPLALPSWDKIIRVVTSLELASLVAMYAFVRLNRLFIS
jgi:putative inorganic carbon (HCO3(-)) transporter